MMAETDEKLKADTSKSLFRDINADDETPEVMEIESLCFKCENNGLTRLFLTRIPFFKDVIVSSFTCDNCGYHNTELQPGGRIQDKGVKYTVNIQNLKDLNRQVVQTNTATIAIPKLEFENPPNKGVLTTVEGIVQRAVEGLSQDQPLRKIQHPEVAAQIDEFIVKLNELLLLKEPFDLVLTDPSGNSYIENLYAPQTDPQIKISRYNRSKADNEILGLSQDSEQEMKDNEQFDAKEEVATFETNCPNCNDICSTNMKVVDIPHFKEVIIMATNCDKCGHRDNEVKGGSGIEPKGKKITLKINDVSDMNRDVLKSETASLSIPELDFSTGMGTLGGKFTTVEGILLAIKDQLKDSNPFFRGDSSEENLKGKIGQFCDKIDEIIEGKRMGVHFVLDDATGNSYLQNVYAPDDDPEMEIESYDRTFDQNEELGLNDMKTENYESS
ncbi:zinc finger protein ZPR1-like isoform X1 [Mytilus galloprovincialis]|uniref:zinc finger protein ZPR1-like isoform X1 n=2 Tax=Mytilus galloprovincialis TaxID=29158 RepID=UPI003F7C599C